MPGASQAPNDCPAEPRSVKRIVPGGRPAAPCARRHRVREQTADGAVAGSRSRTRPRSARRPSIDWRAASIRRQSSASSSAGGCASVRRRGPSATRVVQDRREVDAAVTPLRERRVDVEQVDAADEIVEPRDAELRHDPPRLLGDEEEEVDDVLGLAGELLAELGILRRDPDRARVQVAGAHHHAAGCDQRRCREAHLVGAEERSDHDVATGLQLSVRLHPDARAQPVPHQRLLRLGEPDLPRDAGVEDRRERRGAGAAVVARR